MSTRTVVRAGLIAAAYVALTLALAPISYGPVQFRVSEALTILPMFTPAAIPGLAVGVLVANWLGPIGPLDVIFGTLATLLAAGGTYALRKRPLLAMACPVIANALIVPAYLPIALGASDFPRWFGGPAGLYITAVITVGAGEALAVYGLGSLLMLALRRVGWIPEGTGSAD
jgi:uncharacterized membrane protein